MIRRAVEADRADILRMMGDFYSSDAVMAPVPEENFTRTFDECLKSSVYADLLVCEAGGEVCGYALTAKTYSNEAVGRVLWIEELYVSPECRGRGAGHELLKALLSADCTRFRLEVEKENEGAVRLYESLGFRFFEYDQMVLEAKR